MSNVPTDPRVEMLIGGVWTDITEDCRLGDADSGGGIEITRGVPNEGNVAEPTQLHFTLNNAGGKYSPKNPNSENYGLIGRNTPVRVSLAPVSDNFNVATSDNLGNPDWSINGTRASFEETGGTARLTTTADSQQATQGHYGDVDVLGRFWIGARTNGTEYGVVMRQTQPTLVERWEFETDVSGWSAVGGTLVRSTAQKNGGAASALLTTTGSPTVTQAVIANKATSAGKKYRVRAWVRTAVTRTVRLAVGWYDASNVYFLSEWTDTSVTANTWTYLWMDITAPTSPTAAGYFNISVELPSSPAAGTLVYIDDVSIYDYSSYGWYQAYLRVDTTDSIRVGRLANYTSEAWTLNLSSNVSAAAWYWIRGQIVGNHIRARYWADGTDEPTYWMVTGNDDDPDRIEIPKSGAAGFIGAGGAGTNISVGEIHIRHFRAHAEIAELPPRWDLSRRDRWVKVSARGILRRLGQGRKALRSAVTRHLQTYVDDAVYWYTLEEGNDSSLIASQIPGGLAASVTSNITFESNPETLPGVGGVAYFNEAQAQLVGKAKKHSASTAWTALGFFQVNANPAAEMRLMTVRTTGTSVIWKLNVIAGPTIQVQAVGYSGGAETVLSSATTALLTSEIAYGDYVAYTIYSRQNGANVTWAMNYHKPGSGIFYTTGEFSFAGSLGKLSEVTVGATSTHVAAGGMRVAHISGFNIDLPFVTYDFGSAAWAYQGETAMARFARLCSEHGIPAVTIGVRDDSAQMGPQLPAKLLDLLQECAEVEDAILGENRADFGLYMRGRYTLYNQQPTELDIDEGHLTAPLEPNDDDQQTRNDIEVTRVGGGSARSIQIEGPLNVNPPEEDPNGVGVYDEQIELNAYVDSQLQPIADQRRAKGTTDEARYPSMTADLTSSAYNDDPVLTAEVISIDAGSIIELTNIEVSPDPSSQIVSSYTEKLDAYDWDITWTTTPARIWQVGILGTTTRLDTAHSYTTASFVSGTNTALTVARDDTTKALWVTGSSSPTFPFDILVAGVRLRVTSISGASDPQTLTVEATPVNGVEKTIPSGSQVRLYEPWRIAR